MKTTTDFLKMKQRGEKIVMLTAYDYPTAQFSEKSGVDVILVGDSLGMVVLGYDSTVPVTLEDMTHHGKAVRRGAQNTFIVVDMPFGSYHQSTDLVIERAINLFQQTNANALKLEGAGDVIQQIGALTQAGIPVVAHLGLLPQHASVIGGYKVQGKTTESAKQLIEDAKRVEAAGACMLVIECIPHQLAKIISETLTIPVIGIGAGANVDGQVLVFHDIVHFGDHHIPKFVKEYANIGSATSRAISQYVQEVKDQQFPSEDHHFTMKEETVGSLYGSDKS